MIEILWSSQQIATVCGGGGLLGLVDICKKRYNRFSGAIHLLHTHKFQAFRPTHPPPPLYAQIMTLLWQQYIGVRMALDRPTPFGAYVLNEWPLKRIINLFFTWKTGNIVSFTSVQTQFWYYHTHMYQPGGFPKPLTHEQLARIIHPAALLTIINTNHRRWFE